MNSVSHRALTYGLVAMLGAATAAAGPSRPIRLEALSLEDGLSQATVNSIFQDSRGFLWVGTEDGLNRFDGYEFTVYKNRSDDATSLPGDAIWTIEEDARGHIWVATEGGGVAKWDPQTDSFSRLKLAAGDDPGPTSVRSLLLSDNGTLWIGTRLSGLWRVNPETGDFIQYRNDPDAADSLASDAVFALAEDIDGRLWVGTEDGLDRLNPTTGSFEHWRNDPLVADTLADNRIRALWVDDDGTLWVGSYGGGVSRRYADGPMKAFRPDPQDDHSIPHERIRAIVADSHGRLWVGTAGGLCLFDRRAERCQVYRSEPGVPGSLADSDIMSVFQDHGGILWFGTRSGGLHRWNPRAWQFGHVAPGPESLSHGTVTGFAEDDAEKLWIATLGGGLNRLDRSSGEMRRFQHDPEDPESIASNFIASLLVDPDGSLWVGSFDAGLLHLREDGSTIERFSAQPDDPTALAAEGVTALVRDRRGQLWIGTFGGGLHVMDRDTKALQRLGAEHGLSSPRVISLAEDTRGRIWIGTDAGGINLLDPDSHTFTVFEHDPNDPAGLPSDTVFSIYGGDTDAIWIGTRGAGLIRLDLASLDAGAPRFEAYAESQGLANDVIYGVRPDDEGRLWLSSNNGLIRFDPDTAEVRNYTVSDGLQSGEFTFGSHYRSRRGELYFGGVNGYNEFDPAAIQPNEHVPPLALSSVYLMGQRMSGSTPAFSLKNMQLGYRDDVLSFEFAALDYADPRRNRYAYRLDGFNEDWIDLDHHRRVTFTDLDGGSYVLRVKAANNDGAWTDPGFALPIQVAPPPWKTAWAYMVYAALVLGALYLYSAAQRRKLAREEAYSRDLERQVRDRTRELEERNDDLESSNAKLHEASLTDALTGLRNRRFLAEHIGEETSLVSRRYSKLAEGVERIRVFDLVFLVIDLDEFKSINDTCGHLAGDEILVQMRDVLTASCRRSDILIRWGGDEFLVVARDANPDRGRNIATRIRDSLRGKTFRIGDGQTVRLTCSIGFACFPFVRGSAALFSWNDVLMFADTALYAAKASGRDTWVGILDTEASPTTELPAAVRQDPAGALANGLIRVISSVDDPENLKWN